MSKAPVPLPVTVLSGFVAAGKTALLEHILANRGGQNVAVIVNGDTSEKTTPGASASGSERVELQGGCICCTLRDDLLLEVSKLASEGGFDHLVIESAGVSEPQSLAETFAFQDAGGRPLSSSARLDTLVTVVDAERFLADWQSEDDLADRQLALGGDDARSISELLVEQIELANVLVLNKLDLVSTRDAGRVEAVLQLLNPDAVLLRSEHGRVPLPAVLGTGLFDFAKTAEAAGWQKALRGEPIPASAEHGVSSFVYRARRPFHPVRFGALLDDPETWSGVLRSKGIFWLASRMGVAGEWSQAGGSGTHGGAGMWYAAVPESEWPDDADDRVQLVSDWQEPWGDRRQELVFMGIELDEAALRARLDAALVDAGELRLGPEGWVSLPDPFPTWLASDEADSEED